MRPEVLDPRRGARLPRAARAAARAADCCSADMPLLNIYEHYRDHGWGERKPVAASWRTWARTGSARTRRPTERRGGTSTASRAPGGGLYEYLRADGSPFLRIPSFNTAYRSTWPRRIQQLGTDGAIVGEFSSVGQWFRRWIRELLEDGERAFVFIDSRFVVPHLVPMRGRRIRLIYQMHNVHADPPHRWDSERRARLQARAEPRRRHGRDGHADRAPARRHRRAPGPDEQPVRRPQSRARCPNRRRSGRRAIRTG